MIYKCGEQKLLEFLWNAPRSRSASTRFRVVLLNSTAILKLPDSYHREEKNMSTQNPKKNMELIEMTVAALREFAPETAFGGVKLADFEPDAEVCRADREAIIDHDNAGRGLIVKRDNDDEKALEKRELIVNGVIGDPNFGPDSALYEALGFVRKSERKSGLTRKKHETVK